MSAKNLRDVMHSSNVLMNPFTRAICIGTAIYVVYLAVSPTKPVTRMTPYYSEYRKAKGLPDIPVKHPAFVVKEQRIMSAEEVAELNATGMTR